ncbi:MAG: hypothetical protein RL228_10, partial [Actinomycetota bacterium]
MREVYAKVIATITLLSIAMGVILSGVLLPAIATIGVVTNGSFNGYNGIPSALTKPPLPQRTVVLAADGTKIATLYYQDRVEVPISEISQTMQDAIVAIEDSRFYSHHGFDLRGTLRALVSNATSGSVQGGS